MDLHRNPLENNVDSDRHTVKIGDVADRAVTLLALLRVTNKHYVIIFFDKK